MSRDIWTTWKWRDDPAAPRGWEHPERMVVLVDGTYAAEADGLSVVGDGPLAMAEHAIGMAAKRGALFVYVEGAAALRWATRRGARFDAGPFAGGPVPASIPALRGERQADLSAEAARALCGVKAQHRALVVSPCETLAINGYLCRYCNGTDVGDWERPTAPPKGSYGYCRTCGMQADSLVLHGVYDLVIVRGPTGPDAWPMHPAWVRSIRDQCAEAGVPFAFMGWGTWEPSAQIDAGAAFPTRFLDGAEHLALPEGL